MHSCAGFMEPCVKTCKTGLPTARMAPAWAKIDSVRGKSALSTPSSSHPSIQASSADLADWSGPELLDAYARRAASPVAVAKAVIARIEAYEPRLQALYAF